VPRVPELGIPKDARVMPAKVELLKMEAPEMYVSLTAKIAERKGLIVSLYMSNEPMPLSLDDDKEIGRASCRERVFFDV